MQQIKVCECACALSGDETPGQGCQVTQPRCDPVLCVLGYTDP